MTRQEAERAVCDFEQAVIDHERETVAKKYTREEVIVSRHQLIADLASKATQGAHPGDIVEIEIPARSSTSKDGMRYRGVLVAKGEESEREAPVPSMRKVR